MTLSTLLRASILSAAAAGASALAVPASAQGGYYEPDGTYVTEGVTVLSPHVGRSAIGAPIRLVSTSRVVSVSDLDLSTPWGARTLKARIQRAARDACDQLDAQYPITDENSPDCYSTAVRNAYADAEDLTGVYLASY